MSLLGRSGALVTGTARPRHAWRGTREAARTREAGPSRVYSMRRVPRCRVRGRRGPGCATLGRRAVATAGRSPPPPAQADMSSLSLYITLDYTTPDRVVSDVRHRFSLIFVTTITISDYKSCEFTFKLFNFS